MLFPQELQKAKSTPKNGPILVGVCGGSASGKTSVAKGIYNIIGEQHSLLFSLDNYYYGLTPEERKDIDNYNFDDPSTLDMDLAYEHLKKLLSSETIDQPIYHFNGNYRDKNTRKVAPQKLIIFEGIFSLYDERIRDLMTLKLYVETDRDEMVIRRIQRDAGERGWGIINGLDRYNRFVREALIHIIEPCKKYADLVIPNGAQNSIPIEMVGEYLKQVIGV